VHLGCRSRDPVPILAAEREDSILYQVIFKTEVSCHSHCCLDRIVGDYSGDHQEILTRGAQPRLEIGSDEGAVGPLRNNDFARQRLCLGLEFVPRPGR
jgi:hypothetical protein